MKQNLEMAEYFINYELGTESEIKVHSTQADNLGVPLHKYLIKKHIYPELKVMKVLAKYYDIPFMQVDMLKIDKEFLSKFSVDFIKKHKILPIMESEGKALFATSNPYNFVGINAISNYYSGKLDFILSPESEIVKYIESIDAKSSTANALDAFDRESIGDIDNHLTENEKAESAIKNTPAVRFIDSIIREAITMRASDIHIEPSEDKVVVRYRIDGDLVERANFASEFYPAVCARLKIMSGLNIAERRIPQDGRFDANLNDQDFDFRVSTLPTVYGEKFVVRILDKTSFTFTRSELGFLDKDNAMLDKTLAHPHGIVLLTGPTGCGKSTTLYSFLKQLNKPNKNIVTVEDPVEYTMEGINQTQVNTKANLTFASALRSILRQDPDIIMVGEIRDAETAQIAVRAAITGHLVLSTLHTNDAPGAVTRLVDMGVSNYLVADALVCVVSQRLVKRLCPMCKEKSKTTKKEMELLNIDKPITVFRPVGCPYCNDSGYRGRLAVLEIMQLNDEIRQAITQNATLEIIRELAKKNGMTEISTACLERVKNGDTSLSEMLALKID